MSQCDYGNCKKRPLKGFITCKEHTIKYGDFKNTECPVCLEEDKGMYPLVCMHSIHLECAKGLTKRECPLCRSEITNFPPRVLKAIKQNTDEDESEDVSLFIIETDDNPLEFIRFLSTVYRMWMDENLEPL